MAGLITALVFPYTDIPGQAWERLSSIFQKVFLLQAAGMEPAPWLVSAQTLGVLEILQPGADRFDQGEIRQVLAQTGDWVLNIRDPKEISHLRGMLDSDKDESSPLALATAIRHQGQDPEDKGFMAHLMLHLAAWHDERQKEADQAVAKLESAERSLRESLGGGPDQDNQAIYPSINPLAPKQTKTDPLAGLRLEAWSRLMGQTGVKADVWITGPEIYGHLAEKYEEATKTEPVRLNSLDRERARGILAETGLEALQDRSFLDLIQFESPGLPGLLKTGPQGPEDGTIVGVMEI